MRTALDSSVLILVLRHQSGWEAWRNTLSRAAAEGPLLICPIVFAECSIGFPSSSVALQQFDSLHIHFDPLEAESAWFAGQTFLRYRREGGPRQHLIPDFLIAAHALLQAERLAAVDRGYLRTYFPELKLLEVTGAE